MPQLSTTAYPDFIYDSHRKHISQSLIGQSKILSFLPTLRNAKIGRHTRSGYNVAGNHMMSVTAD